MAEQRPRYKKPEENKENEEVKTEEAQEEEAKKKKGMDTGMSNMAYKVAQIGPKWDKSVTF